MVPTDRPMWQFRSVRTAARKRVGSFSSSLHDDTHLQKDSCLREYWLWPRAHNPLRPWTPG